MRHLNFLEITIIRKQHQFSYDIYRNPPPQIALSPETHVIPMTINITPFAVYSVEPKHTQSGKKNTRKNLSFNIFYMISTITINSITPTVKSNPITRNIQN
jgi:hypothetical protein